MDRLVTSGALSFDTQAFRSWDHARAPLQVTDRDIDNITVKQLATRRSGLQRDFGADFRMIASLLGQSVMPTREQLVRYISAYIHSMRVRELSTLTRTALSRC